MSPAVKPIRIKGAFRTRTGRESREESGSKPEPLLDRNRVGIWLELGSERREKIDTDRRANRPGDPEQKPWMISRAISEGSRGECSGEFGWS